MFNRMKWRNVNIGGKYLVIFSIMAVTFLLSILITFLSLSKTSSTMEETVVKNEVAIYSGDLVTLYHEKYILIPEYILLSDDTKLNQYLDFSKEFVLTAKKLKQHLSGEQLDLFYQMIENNHELDQYFLV
ncbi:CHASE3 domain-containing protein [Caldalkalibacillus mannanilyticus]|uniref:CHASE3 domain-containing protein n=1 Tax=Caldalkalibacillus mannanilyticus TaxID=1418 RepID=UPI000A98C036|nr:hypothetical protein [Caldalkalibacillus mannanilyticus]